MNSPISLAGRGRHHAGIHGMGIPTCLVAANRSRLCGGTRTRARSATLSINDAERAMRRVELHSTGEQVESALRSPPPHRNPARRKPGHVFAAFADRDAVFGCPGEGGDDFPRGGQAVGVTE